MKSRHEEFIPQEIGFFLPSHPTVRADLREGRAVDCPRWVLLTFTNNVKFFSRKTKIQEEIGAVLVELTMAPATN